MKPICFVYHDKTYATIEINWRLKWTPESFFRALECEAQGIIYDMKEVMKGNFDPSKLIWNFVCPPNFVRP